MLKLHLIRHAKTTQESISGKDFDRELLPKGVAQANLLGHVLSTHHIDMGTFLVSSAVRTKQTYKILSEHLPEACEADFRESLYHAPFAGILSSLHDEKSNIVTVVGHNNGISDFASYLTGEDIDMQTCELLTLSFPFESWDMLSQNTGILEFRYRPEVFVP